MNTKIFSIILLFLFGIIFINLSYSTSEGLTVYSNSQMGIEFKYPSIWELDSDTTTDKNCDPFCSVSFKIPSDGIIPVFIHSYNLNHPSIASKCLCTTLKQFVKWAYNLEPVTVLVRLSGEVIYDKPIVINNNISSWEMESKFKPGILNERQTYYFWTLHNDIGYFISYAADEGIQYEKYLPEVKDMIGSTKFLPIEIPKRNIPSFLQ